MAKFGIALGSGPRGLGFESRYSDQNSGDHIRGRRNFFRIGIRKAVKKTCRWHVFRPWENPLLHRRTPCGCGYGAILFDAANPIITLRPKNWNPLLRVPVFLLCCGIRIDYGGSSGSRTRILWMRAEIKTGTPYGILLFHAYSKGRLHVGVVFFFQAGVSWHVQKRRYHNPIIYIVFYTLFAIIVSIILLRQ